jgi:DNA anti-recombination protein RmuC
MEAKIARGQERAIKIEEQYIPEIEERGEVERYQAMVAEGRHKEAIIEYFVKGKGKLQSETRYLEVQEMTREITQDLREVKQACNKEQKSQNMQIIQKIKSQMQSIAQEEEKKGGVLPMV